jgi:hypothetical protein
MAVARNMLAIAVASVLGACGMGTTQFSDTGVIDSGPGHGSGDGGDAGSDAGVDGGVDAGVDAGCVPTTGDRMVTSATDNCFGAPPVNAFAILTVLNCGNVQLNISNPGTQCTGSIAGSLNAFTGTCGSHNDCTSASLPGTISCVVTGSTSCTISVCGGLDGGCPP